MCSADCSARPALAACAHTGVLQLLHSRIVVHFYNEANMQAAAQPSQAAASSHAYFRGYFRGSVGGGWDSSFLPAAHIGLFTPRRMILTLNLEL